MIEQEMIFGLGFCTAGLLALACLPAVWRRAIRLTTQRLTRLVPLSMEEIVAERDGLRAGFAVGQRRLEQRLEETESRRSALMVQLGRKDAALAALEDAAEQAAARIADLKGELDTTTRELRDVRCETGTAAVALHDLTGLVERQRWDVLAAEETARTHAATVDRNRVTIASLEMRILGLDDRMADADRALGNARAELARTEQAVLRAVGERDAALKAREAVLAERDTLAAETTRLKSLADEAQHRAAAEMQAASAHKATIAESQVTHAALEARVAMQAEAARGAAQKLGEVEAARAELAARLASLESASPQSSPDEELAVLRDALRRVADDVLRLTEADARPSTAAVSGVSALPLAAGLSLPN